VYYCFNCHWRRNNAVVGSRVPRHGLLFGSEKIHLSFHEYKKRRNKYMRVGFEVLTAVSTKMAVFWIVAPSSVVEVYRRFRGPCCLYHQGIMEAAGTSEMSVNFYHPTRRNNPEDSHLYIKNMLVICGNKLPRILGFYARWR
jgi:hypothetical protein